MAELSDLGHAVKAEQLWMRPSPQSHGRRKREGVEGVSSPGDQNSKRDWADSDNTGFRSRIYREHWEHEPAVIRAGRYA